MYSRYARAVREFVDKAGRSNCRYAHVPTQRADAQGAAVRPVSGRSSSRSRRDVIEHHHGTT